MTTILAQGWGSTVRSLGVHDLIDQQLEHSLTASRNDWDQQRQAAAHVHERAMAAMCRTPFHSAVLLEADLTIAWASESIASVLGIHPPDLVGTNAIDLVHADDLADVADALAVVHDRELSGDGAEEDGFLPLSIRLRHRVKDWVAVNVTGFNFLELPKVGGLLVLLERELDPTALDRVIELIALDAGQDHTLGAVAEYVESRIHSGRCLVVADDGHVVSTLRLSPRAIDDAVMAVAGVTKPTTLGSVPARLADEIDGASCMWIVPILDPHGSPLGSLTFVRSSPRPLSPSPRQILEIGARLASLVLVERRIKMRLAHEATHDVLTGLLNRAGFERAIELIGSDQPVTALYIDLDNFKPVNDLYGHAAGDEALRVFAKRLAASVRPDDLVARLGGDEFAVLAVGITDPAQVNTLAQRILWRAAEPIHLSGDANVCVAASIGVAHGCRPSQQMRRADASLYEAKSLGKSRYVIAGDAEQS